MHDTLRPGPPGVVLLLEANDEAAWLQLVDLRCVASEAQRAAAVGQVAAHEHDPVVVVHGDSGPPAVELLAEVGDPTGSSLCAEAGEEDAAVGVEVCGGLDNDCDGLFDAQDASVPACATLGVCGSWLVDWDPLASDTLDRADVPDAMVLVTVFDAAGQSSWTETVVTQNGSSSSLPLWPWSRMSFRYQGSPPYAPSAVVELVNERGRRRRGRQAAAGRPRRVRQTVAMSRGRGEEGRGEGYSRSSFV